MLKIVIRTEKIVTFDKTIKEVIFFSALFFSLISCNYLIDSKKQTSMTEFNSDELKYRPSFHFSPKKTG